jgi:hypothetical protein
MLPRLKRHFKMPSDAEYNQTPSRGSVNSFCSPSRVLPMKMADLAKIVDNMDVEFELTSD